MKICLDLHVYTGQLPLTYYHGDETRLKPESYLKWLVFSLVNP